MFVYQVIESNQLYLSLCIEVDRVYWRKRGADIAILFSTSSIGEAYSWIQNRKDQYIMNGKKPVALSKYHQLFLSWSSLEQEAEKLFNLLQGRALLWSELISFLHKKNIINIKLTLLPILQLLYLENRMEIKPGVTCNDVIYRWTCHRCMSDRKYLRMTDCATCGKQCSMCEQCIWLGRSRTCTPFFLFAPSSIKKEKLISVKPLSLTAAQQKVCEQILSFTQSEEKQFLLWAVTGAGKTEMMVPVIAQIRSEGKKICWVTPRKDVVHELQPRIKRIFPQERVLALYGGSSDLWMEGDIVIATAHQLWRYFQAFDLIIVDEVDAFPLYQNIALEKGIERALSTGGKMILLTATPPRQWLEWSRSGKLPSATLSARYHGHPLPVPKLIQERRLWDKIENRKPITPFNHFIKQVITYQGQALIFVPEIRRVKQVLEWIRENGHGHLAMAGVYSQMSNREEVIRRFRNVELDCLVTTTILERGVTVPKCFVMVLGADNLLFDQAALIQMAGRVGRSSTYPYGEVWFLATERTEGQLQAKKQITYLNRLAKKEGFIRKEAYYQ
ncbi:DEAD/DEAH box helicase [Thermoflavimicrobium daqui]|nr:DEAD/DEAH box helicase [Thermoflavimicrobium daqui]